MNTMKQTLSGMIYACKKLTAVDGGLFANLEDVKTDRPGRERKDSKEMKKSGVGKPEKIFETFKDSFFFSLS